MPIDPRVRIRPDHEKSGHIIIPRVITVDYARRARAWKSRQLWDAGRLDADQMVIYESSPTQPVVDGWVCVAVFGHRWTREVWKVCLHLETERVRIVSASWGPNPGIVEDVNLSGIELMYP